MLSRISQVAEGGAAFKDKRLKVGQRILEVSVFHLVFVLVLLLSPFLLLFCFCFWQFGSNDKRDVNRW